MTERLSNCGPDHSAVELVNRRLASLSHVYDAVPVGLCLIDPDLRFVSLNRRMAEMSGRPAEAAIGRGLAEVVPDVAAQFKPHLRRALQGERVTDLELQGTKIGGVCDGPVYLVCLEPARDEGEEIAGVLCSALDITERKRAEEVLWDHRERLSNLIEQAAVGIAQTDLQGRFLFVNSRYCEITGRDQAALCGSLMPHITHPDDAPSSMDFVKRLAETGEPFSIEKRYVRPDGSVKRLRQVKTRLVLTSYCRATKDTDASGTNDAATISRLSASGHNRCRRRTRRGVSITPVVDTICRTPATKAGSFPQAAQQR